METLDDGQIAVYRFTGSLSNEDILSLLGDRSEGLSNPDVKLFIVDVSEAKFNEIRPKHIRQFAAAAREKRKPSGDNRPTLIVAPNALMRGLSNMMSGFRGDDIQVAFASFDEALTWARDYIEEHS